VIVCRSKSTSRGLTDKLPDVRVSAKKANKTAKLAAVADRGWKLRLLRMAREFCHWVEVNSRLPVHRSRCSCRKVRNVASKKCVLCFEVENLTSYEGRRSWVTRLALVPEFQKSVIEAIVRIDQLLGRRISGGGRGGDGAL